VTRSPSSRISRAGVLAGGLALADDLDAGAHEGAVADAGGGGAVVHGEEERAGVLAGPGGGASLVAQDLVDVGGVAVVVGEGEAADVAVALLDLLEGERDLVEVAEQKLIARDLDVEVGAGVELFLLPAHGLVLGHARGDAVDLDLVAALLFAAQGDERLDQREQAVALGALRGDDSPALGLEVVGVAALVPEVTGVARGLLAGALLAGGAVGQTFGQHGGAVVGVDHQEVQVGDVGVHLLYDWRARRL
jgi:hypothetical protein